MSDTLFPMPDSPLPPLEQARRELARAIEAEKAANIAYDEACDDDDMTPNEMRALEEAAVDAEQHREDCELALAKLEREAMENGN
jgi:hypothetical protein